jgi:hypothetical protein
MCKRAVFGGIRQDIVEFTSTVLGPEPLDAEIERRCKQAWEDAPCPERCETAIQSGDDSPRVWCSSCRYIHLHMEHALPRPGASLDEIGIAPVLYADTLLSMHQITQLFDAVYDTVHTTIREGEAAFERGFSLVWERIRHAIDGPTQIDETGHNCSGYKSQTPPRESPSRGGAVKAVEHAGEEHQVMS